MSIDRRGNGWRVRWRDANGQRTKTFRRKIDAQQFEAEILTDLRRGEYVAPSDSSISLQAWAGEWLAGAHHLRPRSRAIYEAALAHITPVLGGLPLAKITGPDIDRYCAGRLAEGAAPSTVHREWRTLKTLFRRAVRARRLIRSPVEDSTEPRIPAHEMLFLSVEELERLAAAFDPRWRTWVLVAGWGGLRWGETVGLTVGDVDLGDERREGRVHVVRQMTDDGQIAEPKGHGRRWVSLPRSVTAELAAHIDGRAPGDLVWTMPHGGHLKHRNWVGHVERPAEGDRPRREGRGWFKRAVQAAGLPPELRPHDLRHTAVALAIAAGAHPSAIQRRMGHSSIRVTLDTYGHLFPEMDSELAGRLDGMRDQRRRLVAV